MRLHICTLSSLTSLTCPSLSYESIRRMCNQLVYTHRAAVYYEMGEFEKSIADCDAAVERGRELRADYKMIARALTRKANSLVKLGNLEDAIGIYQKALTEHRY